MEARHRPPFVFSDQQIEISTMYISKLGFPRQRSAVITANIPRIEPDPPGGWFVIRGSYGWLYGSRSEAVRAVRELAQEQRP